MSYDAPKRFAGRPYTGMAVGGSHDWLYPDGDWHESKVSPEKWTFTFRSKKRRRHAAPVGSGAPVGAQYHWYILADQKVRKVDQDTYETFMEGVKYKLAHKRPHWRRWSAEYPDQRGVRERMIDILESTLAELKGESAAPAPGPAEPATTAPPSSSLPLPHLSFMPAIEMLRPRDAPPPSAARTPRPPA